LPAPDRGHRPSTRSRPSTLLTDRGMALPLRLNVASRQSSPSHSIEMRASCHSGRASSGFPSSERKATLEGRDEPMHGAIGAHVPHLVLAEWEVLPGGLFQLLQDAG